MPTVVSIKLLLSSKAFLETKMGSNLNMANTIGSYNQGLRLLRQTFSNVHIIDIGTQGAHALTFHKVIFEVPLFR